MLKLKLADYPNVYLVDGQYIRDNIDIDFTEGGNWLRYDYVPEGEIWLGGIHILESPYVMLHEITEVNYALEHGLNLRDEIEYSEAHEFANQAELAARHAPNTVFEKLNEAFSNRPQEEKTIWQNR